MLMRGRIGFKTTHYMMFHTGCYRSSLELLQLSEGSKTAHRYVDYQSLTLLTPATLSKEIDGEECP